MYRTNSLFKPLTEKEIVKNRMKGYREVTNYDSRAIINEEEGVQVQSQPQTTVPQQNAAQSQGQQPVQQNQGQQTQQNPQQSQGQQPAIVQPNNILNDQTWKAYQQNPSYETLKAFYDKLSQVMQKMNAQFGGGQNQQNAVQPQGQTPQNTQQPQQPQQSQNTQQPSQPVQPVQPNNVKESFFFRTARKLNENEDNSKDEGQDSSTAKTSQDAKEKGSEGNVKYDNAYNKDDGGKEHDFGWDKYMRDSIFGTKEDVFQNTPSDVKYGEGYGNPISPSDRDKMEFQMTPTKPEPFKPEKPSFVSMSNPDAMAKTVFTTGKVEIKDAPAVAKSQEEKPVGPEIKGNEKSAENKSSEESNSQTKKTEDDGSDDANESFFTDYDSFLNEGYVEDSLKKVIVQEFLNKFGGVFDLGEFDEWISDNYPQIANDPQAFDEVSSDIERQSDSESHLEEDDDKDLDDDDIVEDEDGEVFSLEEVVEEYMEQYEDDEYDEDDAKEWLEANYEVDEETTEDFLDAVSDMFVEDDINESFDDEFFPNEATLNE